MSTSNLDDLDNLLKTMSWIGRFSPRRRSFIVSHFKNYINQHRDNPSLMGFEAYLRQKSKYFPWLMPGQKKAVSTHIQNKPLIDLSTTNPRASGGSRSLIQQQPARRASGEAPLTAAGGNLYDSKKQQPASTQRISGRRSTSGTRRTFEDQPQVAAVRKPSGGSYSGNGLPIIIQPQVIAGKSRDSGDLSEKDITARENKQSGSQKIVAFAQPAAPMHPILNQQDQKDPKVRQLRQKIKKWSLRQRQAHYQTCALFVDVNYVHFIGFEELNNLDVMLLPKSYIPDYYKKFLKQNESSQQTRKHLDSLTRATVKSALGRYELKNVLDCQSYGYGIQQKQLDEITKWIENSEKSCSNMKIFFGWDKTLSQSHVCFIDIFSQRDNASVEATFMSYIMGGKTRWDMLKAYFKELKEKYGDSLEYYVITENLGCERPKRDGFLRMVRMLFGDDFPEDHLICLYNYIKRLDEFNRLPTSWMIQVIKEITTN